MGAICSSGDGGAPEAKYKSKEYGLRSKEKRKKKKKEDSRQQQDCVVEPEAVYEEVRVTHHESDAYPDPPLDAMYEPQVDQESELALMTAAERGGPVPLPSFHNMDSDRFRGYPQQPESRAQAEPPCLQVDHLKYGSGSNRLGDYDYSQGHSYHPSQEQTCKRSWKDDPFHGWRSRTEPEPGTQLIPFSGPKERSRGDARVSGKWMRDPFSEWLQKDRVSGHYLRDPFSEWRQRDNVIGGVDENHPELQRVQEFRRLRSLPSFRELHVKGLTNNQDFSRLHTK